MKPLSYRRVVKKARKAGFVFRRTCIIPHHHEIKVGTLKSILKQMGLTEKEFKNL